MYQGAIWTQTKVGKQTQWTKKYFPRVKSPKAAAELVAEYLETTLRSIKVGKSSRESPAQSADRMALLCEVFRGWVPADLENAVSFRGRASFLQACGPAAYVAGLVGKEDRWRDAVLEIWEAMPSSERVRLHTMGSRDRTLALDGARALHAFLSLVVVRWAGWSIPRLGSMSWPVDIKKEIAPQPQDSKLSSKRIADGGSIMCTGVSSSISALVRSHSGWASFGKRPGVLVRS